MTQGPYTEWARGDVVLTVHDIGCNGKTQADAQRRLHKIAKEMEMELRRYWQIGPRAKGISVEITGSERDS